MVTSTAASWRRGWLGLRAGWIAATLMLGWSWMMPPADAGILGFGGDVALIMPPASVESEQLLANDMAGSFLFVERERYTLPTAVDVDWDSSIATNGQIEEGSGFFPGTIPAGTEAARLSLWERRNFGISLYHVEAGIQLHPDIRAKDVVHQPLILRLALDGEILAALNYSA